MFLCRSESPGNLELVALGCGARCITGAIMLPVTVVKVRFEVSYLLLACTSS